MFPGDILRNRYKIIKLLGSGSFGTTYLAKDLDLPENALCVVKSLRQGENQEELQDFTKFFNREGKALYSLGNDCNQIPRLFAHFEEEGKFYVVLEYIDGHDLSQEIFSSNKLSEARTIELLKEILEVLTIVHDKNIIHRDIKAQNLMRRKSDGKIVLIDFGAVKEISQLKVNPDEGTRSVVLGTNGYMPIEQSHGYPKLSSDVYAVGMLGIYALTGVRPQQLPKDPDTFEVIWQDKVSVSPNFASVLDKMVRSNFRERYQNASEALQALKQASEPTGPNTRVSPGPVPVSPPPSFSVVNPRLLIVVGVLVSLVFGMGLFVFIPFLKQSQFIHYVKSVCPEEKLVFDPIQDSEGNKFYGELKNDMYNGCGRVEFKTGDKYVGQFRDGDYEGMGRLIYKNNSCKYIGEFRESQFDGQGICISQDGSRKFGTWREGKLVGTKQTCCN